MILHVSGFTQANAYYDIYFNTVGQYVYVQTTGTPPFISDTGDPGINGMPVPGSSGKQCVDNVYYQFYYSQYSPFATFTATPGGCPVVSTCDLAINSLNITGQSALNVNDGSVTGDIFTTRTPFYCSLDNVNFGSVDNPSFFNLAPGNYTFYVRDNLGCTAQRDFTVTGVAPVYGCTDPAAANYNPSAQVNDGTCVYPEPDPNQPNELSNLYEQPDEFRLLYKSDTWIVDEPKDWDKISIVLKRDIQYHGVNYLFSDGDIKLRFDDPAGRQILIAAYDAEGNDALVRLQFGFDRFGVFSAEFDGYIDFNVYEKQENYVLVGVKRKTFNDLLETRSDTLVTLKDGSIELPLHSKLIRKATLVNTGNKSGDIVTLTINKWNGAAYSGDSPYLSYWTYLDFSAATLNDLCPDAPLTGVYTDNPLDTRQYIFKTDGGGIFDLSFTFQVNCHFKIEQKQIAITNPRHGYWTYRWYLVINNQPNAVELPGSQSGFTNSRYNDINFSTSYTTQLTLNANDEVFLYGQYICEDRGSSKDFVASININFQQITLSGDTLTVPTTTSSFLAFETAQAIMSYVTDGGAKLKSNLLGRTDIGYGSDGCAALLAYSNGYQIRGFEIATRPIKIAFKDWLDGLNAMYCVGMGYEIDDQGNYIVRIEKFDYFYQPVEILLLDTVSDYVEDTETAIIYNEVELGYKKYTNNLPSSQNTLDEFCTVHDYLTPVQSFKQKLSQLCNQIASGYAIELTRRQQFVDTPQDSWTYDDDNFVISTVRTPTGYKSETVENFTASGIIGPETAYNLRLSPGRMLDRWGKWLNSGFAYKKPSDVILNTYVAKNGDLTSKLITPTGCDTLQTITEANSITLGQLAAFEKKFRPDTIKFNKRISWATFSMIRRCCQNIDPNGRNNGYISVVDPEGNTQQGFLMELAYSPESELANFTLRKKYVDLDEPFDCSIYSNDTFSQFEATTGLPAEIEQCTFSNFA